MKFFSPFYSSLLFGSWDNWKNGVAVTVGGSPLYLYLPPGTYQYKYLIGDVWTCDNWAPKEFDNCGNENNVLTVSANEETLANISEDDDNYNFYIAGQLHTQNKLVMWFDEKSPSGKHFEYEITTEHMSITNGMLYYYNYVGDTYTPVAKKHVLYITHSIPNQLQINFP